MHCAIRYQLYNLKNVKNSHGGMLILVKLQALACDFTKINTPPWLFFTFFKLYKWYQIVQRATYYFHNYSFKVSTLFKVKCYVTLAYFSIFIDKHKIGTKQLKSTRGSFNSIIIVNILNKDQVLIPVRSTAHADDPSY